MVVVLLVCAYTSEYILFKSISMFVTMKRSMYYFFIYYFINDITCDVCDGVVISTQDENNPFGKSHMQPFSRSCINPGF